MKIKKPYKYHLRPGYGSAELLLAFFLDDSGTEFVNDLMATLKDIHPNIDTVEGLMIDELLLEVSSDAGSFSFSNDIWGFAFITTNENQLTIMRINELLNDSALFEKEEIDFDKFRNLER